MRGFTIAAICGCSLSTASRIIGTGAYTGWSWRSSSSTCRFAAAMPPSVPYTMAVLVPLVPAAAAAMVAEVSPPASTII